jgi:hypothetical protein
MDRQEEQIAHELKNYHAGQSAQDCTLAIHAKICQFATHRQIEPHFYDPIDLLMWTTTPPVNPSSLSTR